MGYILVSLVCFAGGAITMFFVYRNNLRWFRENEERITGLPRDVKELLRKYGIEV